MLHTKFRGNRSIGLEKKIFEGFSTIYGHGGHFCHVTNIHVMSSNFHILVPEGFHTKFD